jgi:hypothetical protein
MTEKIFRCIEARADEYREFLKEIVCMESGSFDKEGVDAVCEHIRAHAEQCGFQTQVVPFEKSGNGLLVTMNADASLPPATFDFPLIRQDPADSCRRDLFYEIRGIAAGCTAPPCRAPPRRSKGSRHLQNHCPT